jgi:hypothetical protein
MRFGIRPEKLGVGHSDLELNPVALVRWFCFNRAA